MFAAPPAMTAGVFTTIPERFAREGTSVWSAVQFHGAPAPTFLEGPSFDREGNLWVTDIPWGRIFKISPDGKVDLAADYDGEPNGLKFHRDGRGFIADHKHGIMLLDPGGGKVTPYFDRPLLQRFKGVNDLVFASNGDLYFTDQGQTGLQDPSGRVYRLGASGRLDCILDSVPSPNGLVLSADEKMIFLCVTRANAIWRVPLMQDGTASKVGVFIQLSGGIGPDGMAIDAEGNLAVCHVGLGAVWLFSARGEPLLRVNSPVGALTTNCAYGGSDNRTLFITESKSGSVLMAEMPVAGRRLFSHSPP